MNQIFPKIISCLIVMFAFQGCFQSAETQKREAEQKAQQKAIQSNLYGQEQKIDQLQRSLGELQGQIEERDHRAANMRQKDDIAINELRQTVMKMDEKIQNLQTVQLTLFEEIKKMKEAQLKSLRKPKQRKSRRKKKLSSLDRAKAAQKKGKHSETIKILENFVAKYPKSKNFLSANYYLAESYFATRQYKKAIVAYGVLHEKNPKSTLGRKSTLKIAQSFYRRGKKAEAKVFAEEVVKRHPKSAEAQLARKLMQ